MLVRESISFERYKDPKKALGLSVGYDDIETFIENNTNYKYAKDSPSILWICAEHEQYRFVKFLLSEKEYAIETINRGLYEALKNIHNMHEEPTYLTVKILLENGAEAYKAWSQEFDWIKNKYPRIYAIVREYLYK